MPELLWKNPRVVSDSVRVDRALRFTTLEEARDELARLAGARQVVLSPGWTLPQIFEHCAQSLEGVMQGFPKEKPPLFQRTVGSLAFRLFDRRGHMRHGLAEAIPGCEFTPALGTEAGLRRLVDAMERFERYDGPLYPHFAYGHLSKAQIAKANAMHMANHFSAWTLS